MQVYTLDGEAYKVINLNTINLYVYHAIITGELLHYTAAIQNVVPVYVHTVKQQPIPEFGHSGLYAGLR